MKKNLSISFPKISLINWFLLSKRDFPWRETKNPYHVWVSEVMLQQTRAEVVVPYFNKWLKRFPTVEDLADANMQDVLKAWEGLGYYKRAVNLHEGAKLIVSKYGGRLPNDKHELSSIKGIGPYTLGAILSFGFHKKGVALDGNVMRVLARYYCIEENIDRNKKLLYELLDNLLPKDKPYIFMEALIELGALICKKKPRCSICPISSTCKGRYKAHLLPNKTKKEKISAIKRIVIILEYANHFLIRKVPDGQIMAGLHEFPYFSFDSLSEVDVEAFVLENFSIEAELENSLDPIVHHFTKYRVTLYPYYLKTKQNKTVKNMIWASPEELKEFAFPSGHRQLINSCLSMSY